MVSTKAKVLYHELTIYIHLVNHADGPAHDVCVHNYATGPAHDIHTNFYNS